MRIHPAIPMLTLVAVVAAMPPSAWATADCSTMQGTTNAADAAKFKTADVVTCVHQGWDPPAALVPDPAGGQLGANASGSGGFSIGTVQAPEKPPQTAGAASSASNSALNFNSIMGALFGSGSGSSTGTGSTTTTPAATDACPVRDDTTGTYGPLVTLPQSAPFSQSLACGGAVPLTNYRITLVTNPQGLAVTEYNTNYVWLYSAGTSSYSLIGGAAAALPQYLCGQHHDAFGNTYRQRITPASNNILANIPTTGFAPQAQMVTYNANTQSIALKVVHTTPDDANSDPFDPANTSEYFLVLPIRGGVPYVPVGVTDDKHYPDNDSSCGLLSDYYKQYSVLQGSSLSGDMIIESSLVPGCEETAAICAQLFPTTTNPQSPTSPTSCETNIVYPSGPSCTGDIQYMVLDHPNLEFPPNTTATAVPVAQRTSFMVSTTSGSTTDSTRLIGPSDLVVHLNQSANVFTFTDGGTLGLAGGNRLQMEGPAIVDMNQLQITLTNGGETDDSGGSPLNSYAAGAVVTIDPSTLPITLQIGQEIVMPNGFAILSEPAPTLREPLVAPQ